MHVEDAAVCLIETLAVSLVPPSIDALSDPMNAMCRGLTVRHDNESFIEGLDVVASALRRLVSWARYPLPQGIKEVQWRAWAMILPTRL